MHDHKQSRSPVDRTETADCFLWSFFSVLKVELWDPVPGIPGTIPCPPDCFIIISSSVCLPTNVTRGARHRSESSLSPKCLAWCLVANIYWAPSVCQTLLWGLAEMVREKRLLSPREACAPLVISSLPPTQRLMFFTVFSVISNIRGKESFREKMWTVRWEWNYKW